MTGEKTKRSVLILRDPKVIRLLADFTRAEIIRLLSGRSMTETQLSKELGITKAAVGYHLQLLKKAGLIEIDKTEVEEHGILQKYYSTSAALFIIDPDSIPEDIKRYFLDMEMEHLRGILAAFKLKNEISRFSADDLKRLAERLLRQLKIAGGKHVKEKTRGEDAELLKIEVYAEALANLTKQREWHRIFKRKT